jgi:hypothetical protein
VRRHDPLWRAELCPAPPLNQIQLMLGCFCCACGYVGNALALSTYPQAGHALACSWLAFTGKGGRDAWRLFRSITTTRFDGWRPPVQRIAASVRRANSWDPSIAARCEPACPPVAPRLRDHPKGVALMARRTAACSRGGLVGPDVMETEARTTGIRRSAAHGEGW